MNERPKGHIAIIDDDAMIRDGVRDCVESAGYTVEAFGSAEEFLGWQPSQQVSCLIIDIQLPGISGLELQGRLSASTDPVPIVFVTGHAVDLNKEQAFANGANALLPKPFRREDLLNALKKAIQS